MKAKFHSEWETSRETTMTSSVSCPLERVLEEQSDLFNG